MDVPPGPEARYEQAESISLAFVTALQVLPPRQLAVLILRDVLGFHASEVAGMLDSTVESVTSALKRARASLQRRQPTPADREPPPAPGSPAEDAIVARFVRAYESADLDALVALLTDDVFMSMPPMPLEYEGQDVVARFCALLFGAGRRFDLVPTRANGQPAFGAYVRGLTASARDRPVRPHPRRRPDLRHDPLREQRAPMVRATAIAPGPVASQELVAADGGKPRLLFRHVLTGEDGPQLVGDAVRIPVERRLEVTPIGRGRVPGQLAFQFGTPLAGSPPAGGLGAGDEYACGK